ncbi:hypothetical protein LTR62_000595 [Meristemomyces frigidus]|uniref:Dicer-like protein 1 n=1 Tax=Meristemomyces frigidus TaxID=1508187 RepID=A0AAN7YLI5_9PEZI|nr:hypothetical protein LTR62_000595 [Meristemomyces frigidus]
MATSLPIPHPVASHHPPAKHSEDDPRDLDDFSDDETPYAPTTLDERRRAQKACFDKWLISDDTLEAIKPKTKEQRLDDADNEELSVQSLMDKQGAQIIKNPRQYQWELFQRAQKENTIAVLDTGSGKTLIAVLLLQWVIDQELERRARGEMPKISFFLVASVTLVYQQYAVLEKNIDHKIARVCGADGADNWNKAKWDDLQAVEISSHLGRYCSNVYLAHALSEKRMSRYELETERNYYLQEANDAVKSNATTASPLSTPATTPDLTPPNLTPTVTTTAEQLPVEKDGMSILLDRKQALVRSIVNFVESEQVKYTTVHSGDLSAKVEELKRYLDHQFENPSSRRCIVFVDKRHTARLLHAVMKQVGKVHMRCGFLVGAGNPNVDEENFTLRSQVVTLTKFRKGDINCLFATSVAEEGLDVPDCNLVIRFDLYNTMIQYVQSRGRARQHNSKFIHMVEAGNMAHMELLNRVRYEERIMRRFCEALPEDRLLDSGNDKDGRLDALMAKERSNRIYIDPISGAKLTYGNALAYLANFVSALPNEANEIYHPTYIVGNEGAKFIAEVMLPGSAPITSAIGRVCAQKGLAKRSAAFEACLLLRQKKFLNEYLLPVYRKKLPAMRNALLAVNMTKSDQYTMRTKPSLWAEGRGTLPTELYITLVEFPDGLEHSHCELVLLTRTPMPDFPEFPVFMHDGRASRLVCRRFERAVKVGKEEMERLSTCTFRVFKDVFSKVYEYRPEMLSYWLVRSKTSAVGTRREVEDCIDWELLEEIYAHEEYKWTSDMDPSELVDKFVVDAWDGGRKFFSTALRPDLRALDPVPEGSAKAKAWMMASILDYSNSLFKAARSRREGTWNLQQPIFEAEKILFRRNMLATPEKKEEEEGLGSRPNVVLCPEPLRISALPPALATSCFVWPAIIHRCEAYLIALEACSLVGVECSPVMALASVTKDFDNSGEHENQTRVNFQRGIGQNYERLEFIGDTFLKTATTIAVYIQNPNDKEYDFHVKRMLMLCNSNLFSVAVELKLYEYVRSMAFSRRLWYPEGLHLLEGKGAGKVEDTSVIKHGLGQKTIADVCEALIGAAFLTHDRPGEVWKPEYWDDAVRAVTKLVKMKDHQMMCWADYSKAYEIPAYQTGEVSASQRDLAAKVELEHPYHFRYPRLLRSAFIHPGMPVLYEKVPDYQRLEFLGDALLDMASISYLFHRFPDKDPQWLTEHKMAMVSNKFLGAVCVNIGFHKHLRHSNSKMAHQISAYADELQEAGRVAGEARDYWTTVSDPPKCLPDIVESFVGALFLDSDCDYNTVIQFFERHVKCYFEDMAVYDTFATNHPCTHLHNMLQTQFACSEYRLLAKELPPAGLHESEGLRKEVVAAVMVHEEVVAWSKGKSARYARLRAAQKAIDALQGLAPFEFRRRFGCKCHVEAEQGDGVVGVDCAV